MPTSLRLPPTTASTAPLSSAISRFLPLVALAFTASSLHATDAGPEGRMPRIMGGPVVAQNTGAPDLNSLRLLAQADRKVPPAPTPAVPAAPADGAAPAAPGPGGGPGFGAGGFRGRGGRGGPGGGAPGDTEGLKIEGDKVTLQFPNNSINDILGIYELLTGKTLIKDTNIFEGQTISLVTPQPVEKSEAIKLIEASMMINGYIIVADPDGKSARILPTRSKDSREMQFSQGVKLYQNVADLPTNETLVSYFMKLDHLDPGQAASVLGNHVGLSIYGRITPVSAPPGLLITESASIVRQLVSIKEVIDTSDTSKALVTKFIPMKYADATTVAQIIQATLDAQAQDKEQKGLSTIRGSGPISSRSSGGAPPPAPAPSANISVSSHGGTGQQLVPKAKSQVVGDPRLNQLLVVAEPDDYAYIVSLITEFDKPVDVPEAYERKLKNVYSIDVLSVLADLLKDTGKGTTQLPGGGTLNLGNQQLISSSSSLLTGRSTSTSNQRGGSISRTGTTGSSSDGTTGAVGSSVPDQLVEATQDNAPVSVLVNKTRVIADPLANSIIVIGPKEDKDKVNMLLDKLDQKSPQAYLATVIGELTLDDGVSTGVDYLQHFRPAGESHGIASSNINGRPDVITNNNVSDVRNMDITSAFGPVKGFNVYGQISQALDVFVTALETTTKFKVLSRPSVFALNNKKAVITSGQSVPVATSSLSNAASTGVNGNGNVTQAFSYKDVVLKLEVIPLIDPDGTITLKVAQTNDTVVGQQQVAPGVTNPIIGTEQLTTTVTVPNKNTVVLGGLISDTINNTTSGIPYISRLPLLGRLFKNDSRDRIRKELIIFIQPTVVENDLAIRRASLQEDLRSHVGEDAYKAFPEEVVPVARPAVPLTKEQMARRESWTTRGAPSPSRLAR